MESETISYESKDDHLKYFDFKVIEYDPEKYKDKWIESFDVSQNGSIAVSFNNSNILIADKDFNVKCAFSFNNEYSLTYYVNWNGDNLEMFSNRGKLVTVITPIGEIIDVYRMEYSYDIYRQITDRREDWFNGECYLLKKTGFWMFLSDDYDTLSRVCVNEEEQILFDSQNKVPWFPIIVIPSVVLGSQAFGIFIIVSTLKIRKERLQGKHIENPYAKYFR